MKKFFAIFLFLALMASPACAKKKTFYVYDADEHDYEGRVVWSSDAEYYDAKGKQHSTFIWHILNLKTGEYTELYDNDNSHGPVYFRDVYHEISSFGLIPVWVND